MRSSFFDQPILVVSILGGLGLLFIIAAVFLILRYRRHVDEKPSEPHKLTPVSSKTIQEPIYEGEKKSPQTLTVPLSEATFIEGTASIDDLTSDGQLEKNPVGIVCKLTVKTSDDPEAINHVYNVDHLPVRIGRSSECDIVISKKDQPVSRFHAQLNQAGNQINISEIASEDENVQQRLPRYHTYVNDIQVQAQPVALKSGDLIRLGLRMTMAFESCLKETDDRTVLSFQADPESTMDDFDVKR